VQSLDFEGEGSATLDELGQTRPARAWFDYPLGALQELHAKRPLREGADLLFGATLPAGVGLASSAALLVVTLHAMRELQALDLDLPALAELAYRAETSYVGSRIGRMDPLAAALCREREALLIDFRDGTHRSVAFPAERASLVMFDSGTRHELRHGNQTQRAAEATAALAALRRHRPELPALGHVSRAELEAARRWLGPIEFARAWHVVTEIERVLECAAALKRGDLEAVGHWLDLSHAFLATAL
jgi:galactokinase